MEIEENDTNKQQDENEYDALLPSPGDATRAKDGNLVAFFALLLKVDKRVNPHLYRKTISK